MLVCFCSRRLRDGAPAVCHSTMQILCMAAGRACTIIIYCLHTQVPSRTMIVLTAFSPSSDPPHVWRHTVIARWLTHSN